MAYDGAVWDETTPDNITIANEIDDIALDIKKGVRGRMALEHVWPASQAATGSGGFHNFLTLSAQTGAPSCAYGASTQAAAIFMTGGALTFQSSGGTAVTLVATAAFSPFPSGVMLPCARTTAPAGFYLCDGQAYSRTTDASLFAAISTVWGTGDGSLTFNVPDLQGYTIVGKSASGIFTTLSASTGELTHALSVAELAAHTHEANTRWSNDVGATYGNIRTVDGAAEGTVTSSSTGSGTAHNNVQPSKVVNFIIAR